MHACMATKIIEVSIQSVANLHSTPIGIAAYAWPGQGIDDNRTPKDFVGIIKPMLPADDFPFHFVTKHARHARTSHHSERIVKLSKTS